MRSTWESTWACAASTKRALASSEPVRHQGNPKAVLAFLDGDRYRPLHGLPAEILAQPIDQGAEGRLQVVVPVRWEVWRALGITGKGRQIPGKRQQGAVQGLRVETLDSRQMDRRRARRD